MLEIDGLNKSANYIHEWGAPEQDPWKRIGLTRLGNAAFAVQEAGAILFYSISLLGCQLPVNILKGTFSLFSLSLTQVAKQLLLDLKSSAKTVFVIANIISGLACTLFFGIIFSPEINFRIHQQLGLAINNLGAKKERELKAKLEQEVLSASIRKNRAERFAQFQKEREAAKAAEDQIDNCIDADLAKLLTPG